MITGYRPDGSKWFVLTDRQEHVLELLADGLTDREMGESLYLATETVKNHVMRLKQSMGAKTRAQAVHFAHLGGVLGQHGGAQ